MQKQTIGGFSSKRENARDYIALSQSQEREMLDFIGEQNLDSLYADIPQNCRLGRTKLSDGKSAAEVAEIFSEIAKRNKEYAASFAGDSLTVWNVPQIADEVSRIRGLSTSYTPYQPERSQGTLIAHWIYECVMSQLSGYEAVNCSLYDRATAIFEAAAAACRLTRRNTVLISQSLLPCDIRVVETLARHTKMRLVQIPARPDGTTDSGELRKTLAEVADAACLVFAQTTNIGTLEDVNALVDFCAEAKIKSIGVFDPVLDTVLRCPAQWGANGADIAVAEGQGICTSPNFGGPGLGIFATRYNDSDKTTVRQSPGRFVGKARDILGNPAFAMVLSTREQHIRREKATSNICSNEAFLATLAGACILQRGSAGLEQSAKKARAAAVEAFEKITAIAGFSPLAQAPFFNEFCVKCPAQAKDIIAAISEKFSILAGVDVSQRVSGANGDILKISFTDTADGESVAKLVEALQTFGNGAQKSVVAAEIPPSLLSETPPSIPSFDLDTLRNYYKELGELNLSPDDACYPLGSCTMKYNPLLCDELAALDGFARVHPQTPEADAQGCLEVLWNFTEAVKAITNLDAVALQPVAGAQGELCALKIFQARHADFSDTVRDVILIPSTAHGTNFASAAVAGFEPQHIFHVAHNPDATISLESVKEAVAKYGSRIAAIMITNPNTSGVWEKDFAEIAKLIHSVGGYVFMDGANFNAVAGRVDLKALGVDAMHNNIHKTWAVSHGGGGPGDGFVALDAKFADYIPSYVVSKSANGNFSLLRPKKSIGSLHRNFGNFAHKIRALSYMLRLGNDGVRRMSATAVLASRYLFKRLSQKWDSLPREASLKQRMHEFILTLPKDALAGIVEQGVAEREAAARIGKLFLDFGFHAPTVSFPEVEGLMIEPSESFDKPELDRFADAVIAILSLARECPKAVADAPRLCSVARIDEITANRVPILSERLDKLPDLPKGGIAQTKLLKMSLAEISEMLKKLSHEI